MRRAPTGPVVTVDADLVGCSAQLAKRQASSAPSVNFNKFGICESRGSIPLERGRASDNSRQLSFLPQRTLSSSETSLQQETFSSMEVSRFFTNAKRVRCRLTRRVFH